MKNWVFLFMLIISVMSVFFGLKKFRENSDTLNKRFDHKKYEKLETVIRVEGEVNQKGFKNVFFARSLDDDMKYKVTNNKGGIESGDCLSVSGNISLPLNMTDSDTLYHFPYREYLAKDDIYLLYNVKKFSRSNLCEPLSMYENIKLYFLKYKMKITKIFLDKYEQPYAGLVAGVLIAGKGLMNYKTLGMFKRVSLSHVVVLSGSNVSIIIFCIKYIFDNLFLILRLRKNFITEFFKKILMIILISVFVLLTGGGAPIYRAFVSSVCGLLIFKNQISQVYALTIVVMIMTIINPLATLYDPSFHLTCCATYGLIIFTKRFDEMMIFSRMNFIPDFLREIISVTLATQVFVFPYIVFMSGSFSSVFLISNVLVLPLIPIIMFLGFVSLFFDFAVSINNVMLKIIFYIVEKLANVPYGYFEFGKSVSILILMIYGMFMLYWVWKRKTPT